MIETFDKSERSSNSLSAITTQGIKMVNNPNSESTQPKKVFVISPIGSEGSPERLRADRFLKYIVRKALPAPMYEVERADEHDSPHAITAAMLSAIVDADVCVVDITGRNPNVFYELALAHAMDKHVVIMDGSSEHSPFDIQDQRSIKYGLMPEEVESAVNQLASKAASPVLNERFQDMMNPVATALRAWMDQQKVAQSGDSVDKTLFAAIQGINDRLDRKDRMEFDFREDDRTHLTVYELLEDRAEKLMKILSRLEFSGALDPSLHQLIPNGGKFLGVRRGEQDAVYANLRRWLADAEYVIDSAEKGSMVTAKLLPSRAV